MKIFLYIIIGLILAGLIAFFFMGKSSAKGSAPGIVNGQLSELSDKPNAVSSELGTDESKAIAPFQNTSLAAVKTAIMAQGGVIISDNPNYLSATFTSKIFKFVDDVEVRMDGTTAHIRSASRVGYSDRGVNRARVEALRIALK